MPVRKTESRIPANFQASDLGEAVVAADGRCALVSFVTAPVVVDRDNIYVLFVTDPGLAAIAQSFEWTFVENESPPETFTTQYGETTYRPQSIGKLMIFVRILDAANAEQATIKLEQSIVLTSAELESLIDEARNEPGPGVANPDVLRELVNEHSRYYQNVALQVPEAGDGFKRFLFRLVLDGALKRTPLHRRQQIDRISTSLNVQNNDFVTLTAEGLGVSGIRLPLLAMTLPTALLDWTELPEPSTQHTFADEQLRQKLAALDDNTRIDLFNLARFPKSNITQSGRILEKLRDRYFGGTTFDNVIKGMSGTRALWINRHYREGPLLRS